MPRSDPGSSAAGGCSSLTDLRHYDRGWLRGDVIAGVTVAAYLIPQVMAYAGIAGLPPVAGLWAAGSAIVVYALLGSSHRLSVGPESSTALLTAAAIGPLAAGDPGRYAALAAALAVMVGLVCLLGWVARLGFLADAFSRPVLIGYMAGIAVLMVTSQLGALTGVQISGDSFRSDLMSFVHHANEVGLAAPLLSAVVLVFLLVFGHLWPKAPVPLIGVVLAVIVVVVFHLEDHGILVVGDIPSGFPPGPSRISGGDIGHLLLPAFGVAVVGYTDNVLTGRAFAYRHGETIDARREFLGLAAANIAAGAAHGFPVSSSASRTAIAESVGARSRLYSLVSVATVIAAVVAFNPVLARFPKPALGALVVWAAIRLVDIKELRRISRLRRAELALALLTTASVLVFNVLIGILVAVALSVLDMLRRVARPHDGILGYVPGMAGMHDIDDYPDARLVSGLLVYRYDSPMFFANADDFLRRAMTSVAETPRPLYWFLLNAEANVQIDVTSLDALDDLRVRLEARGVVLALARVKHDLFVDLERTGFTKRIGANRIFPTLPTAVAAYADWHLDRFGVPPSGLPPKIDVPPL